MNSELKAILTKEAKTDLGRARRNGELLIGQTKHGLLSLTYSAGRYALKTQGMNVQTLAEGAVAVVLPVLAAAYVVA